MALKNNLLMVGLSLVLASSAMGCANGQSQTSNSTTATVEQAPQGEKTKESLVRHIDAKFMREHIFDYKASPNKFVFKGKKPAVLDFYADWCGPCRQLSPRIEALAKKYAGQIDVYKINIDNEAELARVFGVQSIPMLLFIGTDGSTPTVSQGALSTENLEAEVNRLLKPGE